MSNTIRMINPSGAEQDVPAELVQGALDRGFSRLPQKAAPRADAVEPTPETAPKARK